MIESRPFHRLFAENARNGLSRPKAQRGKGIKMVNMGELFAHHRIKGASMDLVPLDRSKESQYLLHDRDLLFARQSLVLEGAGKCSIFLDDGEPTTFESHIIRVRLDPRIADPLYYYYYWKSFQGRSAIRSIVEQGAGASGIRSRDLAALSVHWRPVGEQREISRFLNTIDEKIECNERLNGMFEEIVQTIFRDWFVYLGPVRAKRNRAEPYLKSEIWELFPESIGVDGLPRSWRYSHLSEIASVTKGRSYRSSDLVDSNVALVTLKSFNRGGGYRPDGLKPYRGEYKSEQRLNAGDLIVAHTDVTQSADIIGVPAIVPIEEGYDELVASLDVGIVRSDTRKVSNVFLYNLFLSEHFRSHILAYCTGTTVLHLDKRALPSYPVLLPTDDLLDAFNKIAEPMRLRQNQLLNDTKVLKKVRDTLLPKLISGEIHLKDAENFVESVT